MKVSEVFVVICLYLLSNGCIGQTRMTSLKWIPKLPEWSNDVLKLLLEYKVEKSPKQTVKDLIEKSTNFTIKFPVDTVRCEFIKNYISEDTLERNVNSVYPIVHHKALELYCKFILFKRGHGTELEQAFYKDMTLKQFVDRLLNKRAASFVGSHDRYLLLDGTLDDGNWESIGQNDETLPLILEQYLSYDEIKCSAFLSVSSYTYFVNMGDRYNDAKFSEDRSNIEDDGVIIGMIGTRLEKPNVMEWQEIIVTEEQNTQSNGYGTEIQNTLPKLFFDFYDETCRDFQELQKLQESSSPKDEYRYAFLSNGIFDNYMYYKRMAISFDTLLMEANYRAKTANKTAYVHVVGLGLGVWKLSSHQGEVFMDTFADRIELLGKHLHSISDICFSYIKPPELRTYKDGDLFPVADHPLGGIRIYINKREPHTKISNSSEEKLLVVSYAWDGNALPGNEWWLGALDSSGDSAAASSTQIAEIHNPHINPLVSANNLMVATESGVVSLEKYQEMVECYKST